MFCFFLVVEDLFKVREPINLDAIYFLTPTQNSINALINDFPKNGPTRYRAAHIHFTGRKYFDIIFYFYIIHIINNLLTITWQYTDVPLNGVVRFIV